METNEVLNKHARTFSRIRLMMKMLVVLVLGMIIFVQRAKIARFWQWLNS